MDDGIGGIAFPLLILLLLIFSLIALGSRLLPYFFPLLARLPQILRVPDPPSLGPSSLAFRRYTSTSPPRS